MRSFNPEERMFASSDKELPEAEEALYGVLVPENRARAIQLDEFTDLYGSETISRDKAYLYKREKGFADAEEIETNKKFGELFEAIINYQIENSDLMGPTASVIVPSRYDDVANGIDSIVQFKGEKGSTSHLALAIDVTASEKAIAKKFERVRNDIDQGHLSTAKYFKSKNFRGELRPVARVIIGADHNTITDISDLILRFTRMKNTIAENRKRANNSESAETLKKEFSAIRNKLAEHPLHEIVLTEIRTQLEGFQAYALSIGKDPLADQYGKILHIITEVINEKKTPSKLPESPYERDAVFRYIIDNAKSFNSQQTL